MDTEAERVLAAPAVQWRGHFNTASGSHTDVYWKKFEVLTDPSALAIACTPIARQFADLHPDLVVGPTLGGVFVAYEVARQLDAKVLIAERAAGDGRFFRDSKIDLSGATILIVDDVLMTGGTLNELTAAVARHGGRADGVGVLLDRRQGPPSGDAAEPFVVWRAAMSTFEPDDCPLCRSGVPITEMGGTT